MLIYQAVLEKLTSVVFFWCPMGVGRYHLHPTMRKPNESSLGTIFKDKDSKLNHLHHGFRCTVFIHLNVAQSWQK